MNNNRVLSGEIKRPTKAVADYDSLINKPQINDKILEGNKSFSDLGMRPITNKEIKEAFDKIFDGKE